MMTVRKPPPELIRFLSAYPAPVAELFLKVRAVVLAAAPTANEIIVDAYNAVATGYTFTERFKDHYFVVPQLFISVVIMLAFTYVAADVGLMFLCTLFLVVNFGSLRSTPAQSAVIWTMITAGIAFLFLLTDKPIGLPHGSELDSIWPTPRS